MYSLKLFTYDQFAIYILYVSLDRFRVDRAKFSVCTATRQTGLGLGGVTCLLGALKARGHARILLYWTGNQRGRGTHSPWPIASISDGYYENCAQLHTLPNRRGAPPSHHRNSSTARILHVVTTVARRGPRIPTAQISPPHPVD